MKDKNKLTYNKKRFLIKAIVLSTCIFIPAQQSFLTTSYAKNQKLTISRVDKNTVRTSSISKMISILRPKFTVNKRMDVASKIQYALRKHKIDPKIVVAIIDAESEFDHSMISESGDISLAQINVEIWNKEFKRMKKTLIDADRMKNDQIYSLNIMADILMILKDRYEKKDRHWYARYHSGTKKYKQKYIAKLESRFNQIENPKKNQFEVL